MDTPRKRISIVTKIFSVFLAITALDLSAIYIFTGTGQIDQIGRNGILVAENAALKILQILPQGVLADPMADKSFQKKLEAMARTNELDIKNCATVAGDGKIIGDGEGRISPRALKALRLYESEERLFYADLSLGEFSADLFIPFKPAPNLSLRVLSCNLPLESIRDSFYRLLRLSVIILIVTLLMQAGLAWFIYIIFIKRLRLFEKVSEQIGQGDFSGAINYGKRFDEIDHLGYTFNTMRLALAEKTRVLEETLLSLEKANFDLEGDLILGEEIQQSILPEKTAGKAVRWVVTYHPMSRVSGDFYDVYDLPGGAAGILQFDASGHGVPAALLTMMAKISFVEAIQKASAPNRIVASVNDELSQHLQKTGNFLTAFFGIIRPNGKMIYCSAAHTSTLLLRAGAEAILLHPTSLSIGFAPPGGEAFHAAEIELLRGDRLILYTDGLTESRAKNGEAIGVEGVIALAQKFQKLDIGSMHREFFAAWESGVDRRAVEDDVTVMIVELA